MVTFGLFKLLSKHHIFSQLHQQNTVNTVQLLSVRLIAILTIATEAEFDFLEKLKSLQPK